MKNVLYTSDYSPDTKLRIVTSPDNDIVLKIYGTGEMRIATSGGKLHGKRLVNVIQKFNEIIDILSDQNYGEGFKEDIPLGIMQVACDEICKYRCVLSKENLEQKCEECPLTKKLNINLN